MAVAPIHEEDTMVRKSDTQRPGWLLPLAMFVLGVLAGWWGIGWGLWPVTWTNTLPQDLRATERDEYLMMVAESYAATGDLELARQRVATWPPEQLAEDLQRLQERLIGENALRASQVQLLAGALGVAAAPAPIAVMPTPPPPPATETQPASLLRTVCSAGLWVVLVLVGIAVVLMLWNRLRAAHTGEARPAIDESFRFGRGVSESAAEIAEREKQEWPLAAPPSRPATAAEAKPAGEEPEAVAPPAFIEGLRMSRPTQPPVITRPSPGEVRAEPRRPAEPTAAPAERLPSPPIKLGEYTGIYQMSEPDYDEAFDITDNAGTYLGQCGLGVTDPIGRARDQAAALQVWLWDTNDPDTKVKVLMSEGAYRDTALRDQLAGEHPALPIRPGTTFELETYNLLLKGKVERLEYAEQEPLYGVFAEVVVFMEVFQKVQQG